MNQTFSRIVRVAVLCAGVGGVASAQSDSPKLDFDKYGSEATAGSFASSSGQEGNVV